MKDELGQEIWYWNVLGFHFKAEFRVKERIKL